MSLRCSTLFIVIKLRRALLIDEFLFGIDDESRLLSEHFFGIGLTVFDKKVDCHFFVFKELRFFGMNEMIKKSDPTTNTY